MAKEKEERNEPKDLDAIDKILLVEYKKAQDSAQHVDHMGWLISSVMIAASIILLAGVISYYWRIDPFLKVLASILGISLSCLTIYLFNNTQKDKYLKEKRCKCIEGKFRDKYKNKDIMKVCSITPRSCAKCFYWLFLGLMAIIWLIILIASLS